MVIQAFIIKTNPFYSVALLEINLETFNFQKFFT